MHARGSSRLIAAATVVALYACDDDHPPRAGDRCTVGELASGERDDCRDDGLWCGAEGVCLRRPTDGEVCDPAPCGPGLHCHIDKRCGVSRLQGEACASSFECEPGLRCNHGELPELFAVGLCRGLAAEGEPCGFDHASVDTIGSTLPPDYDGIDRGDCAAGLSCTPLFPPPGGDDSPPICADSKGVACFFAGACRPDRTLADGAPCGRLVACKSGVCAVFDPPLSAVPLPGFGKGGEWLGPNVGLCVAPDDAVETCGRADPCAEDFTCLDRRCIAPHSQRPGAICSDVAGVECAFGLVCDGRECRYPEP